jgi:bacterioferritin (cytochrome b1)
MTHKNRDFHALSGELVALLRLTRAEAQVARIRISQARDEVIRRELQDNAEESDRRAIRIQDALKRVGGTPDLVGDAIGRVVALTKATTEQLQPFSEGLLGDLALEQQLRDRVIFTRVLAEAQDERAVVTLMNELEAAHTETIEWIRVRLAELAQGGPVALSPTPPQAAFSTLARFATLPTRQYATLLNKVVDVVRRGRGKAQQSTDAAMDSVRQAAEATGEVIEAGRDAALARTEEVAPSAGVRRAARQTREGLGTVDAKDLSIDGYDALPGNAAVREIKKLDDAEDLQLVLRYEEAHKGRRAVTSAAERRLTELAEKAVGA